MRALKHKSLMIIGILLASLMIFVLSYTVWKTLFYIESDKYGTLLSRELASHAKQWQAGTPDAGYFSELEFFFDSFDYYPKNFMNLIDRDLIQSRFACEAMTDVHSPFAYSASVKCRVVDLDIHYFFSKRYDHPLLLSLILLSAIIAEIGVVKFFTYVARLQEQNILNIIELEKEKLMLEVGAKLVHDIKKGIMTQLNTLNQEFGNDLEMEMMQPDFVERFQSSLKRHFQHINFLNKYIGLLTANLKREKEFHWIHLDHEKLKENLQMVFPSDRFEELPKRLLEEKAVFTYDPSERVSRLLYSDSYQGFMVPEMSFFRILKNISENFNAYGRESLSVEISVDPRLDRVDFKTVNPIGEYEEEIGHSSKLGLSIIKQLLLDNFGNESRILFYRKKGKFHLEMNFPRIKKDTG